MWCLESVGPLPLRYLFIFSLAHYLSWHILLFENYLEWSWERSSILCRYDVNTAFLIRKSCFKKVRTIFAIMLGREPLPWFSSIWIHNIFNRNMNFLVSLCVYSSFIPLFFCLCWSLFTKFCKLLLKRSNIISGLNRRIALKISSSSRKNGLRNQKKVILILSMMSDSKGICNILNCRRCEVLALASGTCDWC